MTALQLLLLVGTGMLSPVTRIESMPIHSSLPIAFVVRMRIWI